MLVVDETGFLKQGQKSVGVKRQYSGTAGKVENCVTAVAARSFLDRELLPTPGMGGGLGAYWQEAGVRKGWPSAPKLAQEMIGRAVAAGVPFAWVTVHPNCTDDCGGGFRNRAGVMCWR